MNSTQELPSKLEATVLEQLLEGDFPELELLRNQIHSARVRREWTGAGFWTYFDLDPSVPRLKGRERLQIGGVYGRHPALQAGIGFTLFVEGGKVSSLEGYTYEEPWPTNLEGLTIEQEPVGEERLRQLAKELRLG